MKSRIFTYAITISTLALLTSGGAQAQQPKDNDGDGHHRFRLSSSTFANGATLPLTMVLSGCPYFAGGADQSPALSWTHVPDGTRSFVVIAFDATAAFTHWGMYNISRKTTALPENAGVTGSTYGTEVANDFGDLSYDGPCPPPQFNPASHQYVFTVYALDVVLPALPSVGDFPPGAETLYHALLKAGREGHILESASTSGFFPMNN